MNSQFLRIDCQFTLILANYYGFIIISANSLWILLVTENHHELIVFFANSLFFSRYQYGSITFFVTSELIPYLFREFTMSSLSVTENHHELIVFFANSLSFSGYQYGSIFLYMDTFFCEFRIENLMFMCNYWSFYHFREFTLNSIFSREFTMNSL